ncbi:glyoxalase [Klebsiella pneumoniae]|nr:glyoxalase [Klebsiella pneumoniae]
MKVLNILIRRCVPIAHFEETVSFYEHLISQKARLRFDYPEYDLKLAQVGSVLLIGGTEQSLAPFRATEATFLVKRHYRLGETSAFHRGNDYQPGEGRAHRLEHAGSASGWHDCRIR